MKSQPPKGARGGEEESYGPQAREGRSTAPGRPANRLQRPPATPTPSINASTTDRLRGCVHRSIDPAGPTLERKRAHMRHAVDLLSRAFGRSRARSQLSRAPAASETQVFALRHFFPSAHHVVVPTLQAIKHAIDHGGLTSPPLGIDNRRLVVGRLPCSCVVGRRRLRRSRAAAAAGGRPTHRSTTKTPWPAAKNAHRGIPSHRGKRPAWRRYRARPRPDPALQVADSGPHGIRRHAFGRCCPWLLCVGCGGVVVAADRAGRRRRQAAAEKGRGGS